MKKINYVLLSILVFLLFYISPLKSIILKNSIKKIYAENIEEIPAIVGITPEFIGTYKVFLNAKETSDYIKVSEGFKRIGARDTETDDLRLHSLFLSTLSSFLAGDISEAYKTGKQAIVLAKKIYPDEKKLVVLDKVIKEIEEGKIKDIEGIKARFKQEGIEISEDDDIFLLAESEKGLKEMEEEINKKIKEGKFLKPLLYKNLEQVNESIKKLKEKCSQSKDISDRISHYLPDIEEEYTELKKEVDSISFTTIQEGMSKIVPVSYKISLLQDKLDDWLKKIENIK